MNVHQIIMFGYAHISLALRQCQSGSVSKFWAVAKLFEHFRIFSNTNVTSTIHIGQSYVSIRSKWAGVGRCAAIAALMVR